MVLLFTLEIILFDYAYFQVEIKYYLVRHFKEFEILLVNGEHIVAYLLFRLL